MHLISWALRCSEKRVVVSTSLMYKCTGLLKVCFEVQGHVDLSSYRRNKNIPKEANLSLVTKIMLVWWERVKLLNMSV